MLVDPNGPGLHPMSDRVQLGRVAAPNRSPKPVVCGIGDLDRLVDGAVLDQRPQRTEVFELHVVGVGGRVVEDRDWKEVAFPFDLIAAVKNSDAIFLNGRPGRLQPQKLRPVLDGPDRGGGIESIA